MLWKLQEKFAHQFLFFLSGMDVRLILKKSAPANPFTSRKVRNRGGKGIGGREARLKRLIKMKRDPRVRADLERLRRSRRRER